MTTIAPMGPSMARRTKHKRDDKTVKIERALAVKAGVIAESKGSTIAEYLSGLLRPLIDRDWPKALGDLERRAGV